MLPCYMAALNIDKFALAEGFHVYVLMRPPYLTFPIQRFNLWFVDLYQRFVDQFKPGASSKTSSINHGNLIRLRAHVATEYPIHGTSHQVQACLGHYILFFHLVTRARALGVPVLRTDILLTLPAEQLRTHLASRLPQGVFSQEGVERFLHAILAARDTPTNMHQRDTTFTSKAENTSGNVPVSSLSVSQRVALHHKLQWNSTRCSIPLTGLAHWCAAQIKGCVDFNDLYGCSGNSYPC